MYSTHIPNISLYTDGSTWIHTYSTHLIVHTYSTHLIVHTDPYVFTTGARIDQCSSRFTDSPDLQTSLTQHLLYWWARMHEHDFVLVLSVNNIHLSPVTSLQIYGFPPAAWSQICVHHAQFSYLLHQYCQNLAIEALRPVHFLPLLFIGCSQWRLNSPNTGAFEDNTLPLEFWTCDEWAGDMCPPVTRNGGASVRAVHRALAGALADHRVTGHGDYAVQQVPSLPSSTMLEQNIVQIHRQQSYQLTHWCLEVQI